LGRVTLASYPETCAGELEDIEVWGGLSTTQIAGLLTEFVEQLLDVERPRRFDPIAIRMILGALVMIFYSLIAPESDGLPSGLPPFDVL
jgi:hypothetical protein